MATKHFIVTDKKDGTKRLVQASNKAAALQHVIGNTFTCEPAKASDVIEMVQGDAKVHIEVAQEEAKGRKKGKPDEKDAADGGVSDENPEGLTAENIWDSSEGHEGNPEQA